MSVPPPVTGGRSSGRGGPDLASALASLPVRRDFAFSADLRQAAWITDDMIEWSLTGPRGSETVHHFDPGFPLPPGTSLEVLEGDRIGVVRPTDTGVEVDVLDTSPRAGRNGPPVTQICVLTTPRTCLLPRVPGAGWQLLAVHDFAGHTVLLRIDWVGAAFTEAGRLPGGVDGGVWLEAPHRLALNVIGESGRGSAFSVDLDAGRFSPLFEASPDSDDRAVLYDPAGRWLVVTTDAFAYPAVGVAQLGADSPGIEFVPPIQGGEEAGTPFGIISYHGRPTVIIRHEDGIRARLRLIDLETREVSEPLPVPDGEVGVPVVSDGSLVRFPFSAPDMPWRPALFDLRTGTFALDPVVDDGPGAGLLPGARAISLPSPVGPMPALFYPAAPTAPETDLIAVALHGGPIQRWGSEFRPEAALFARLGVPVVALDYPGSTGSGQPFMRSLFGEAGVVDVEAVASALDALQAETGRRPILYGESYGAFLALATAAVRKCAGIVAFAPFSSFSSLKENGSPEVRETLELLDNGNSDISGRNLLERCRTIRGKVLIFHGTADRTIPVTESWALAQALRDRNGAGDNDVRYVEISGQGHELFGRRVLQQWFRELTVFVTALSVPRSSAQ